jgi:hypothetical protein
MLRRLLFAPVLPAAAHSASASAGKSQERAVSSPTAPRPVVDVNATPAKKVWTNENLNEARESVSVVGDKRNQKHTMSQSKPADAATVARVRQNLQKLQWQLDVNKQLAAYQDFEDG